MLMNSWLREQISQINILISEIIRDLQRKGGSGQVDKIKIDKLFSMLVNNPGSDKPGYIELILRYWNKNKVLGFDELKDLIQDVAIIFFRHLKDKKVNLSYCNNEGTRFINGIARNTFREAARKKGKAIIRGEEFWAKLKSDNNYLNIGIIENDHIKRALTELSERHRTILTLYWIEQLDPDDIVKIMELGNKKNFRVLLCRAKMLFKKAYSELNE